MFSLSRPPEKTHESAGFPLRGLVRPLGWSVVLHALVLGALAGMAIETEVGVAPAAPLQASLRVPGVEREAEPAPPPLRESAPRQPVIAREPLRDAVPPALTFSVPSVPVPTPAAAARPDASEAATATPVASPGGVATRQDRPPPVTVALAAQPESHGSRGPDAAGLRLYRLALASEARQFRRYPEAARRAGMAGTAEVRITVGEAGASRLTELAQSSGHAVLDNAAVDMLRAAAARTRLPDSLRGQAFAVLLPVVFEVED